MAADGRRLLIIARDLVVLRGHYEDVIAALAAGGVEVTIRFSNDVGLSAEDFGEILRARGADVALKEIPPAKLDASEQLGQRLRQLASLLRYYHPDFESRERLRERRFAAAPTSLVRWARRLGSRGSRAAALSGRVVQQVDRVLPPSEAARQLVDAERPDAVAAVGVIRAPQFVDYLKAAAWRGIPTASWVQSWDNLSTKGLLNFTPDLVFVWNTTQRDELKRYHGISEDHICLTGAQTFDHWFNGEQPSGRDDFCGRNGLDPRHPIILYLASSRTAEQGPGDFFVRWLEAVRASSDPVLKAASVVARPHPTAVGPWIDFELSDPRVIISPSTAQDPINSPEFRRRFRDELHHASVAVGLNTSGMVDAAIFGKPVCTVELPDLVHGQREMPHFKYLLTVGGGLLHTSSSLNEHVTALSELVRRDAYARDERSARFVEEFVRPHGIDVTPAAIFAEQTLGLFDRTSRAHVPGAPARALGRGLGWVAPILRAPLEDAPVVEPFVRRQRKLLAREWKEMKKRPKRTRKLVRRHVRRVRQAIGRRARAWVRS